MASASAVLPQQQQSGAAAATPGQAAGEPAPAAQDPEPVTHGKVLFSRSTSSAAAPPAQAAAETAPPELAASITDAMRAAPLFTRYDFSIHLAPGASSLAVELHATIKNGDTVPLAALPLQLGSALRFEHIRLAGQPLRFAVHPLDSDADSTGVLAEAAVALPQPLAPGAAVELTIEYAGTLVSGAGRLDRLGAPAAVAARTDWDRISEGFTALRGFGDSVWYPVASVPALLGDGNRLFHEIGRQKQRNAGALVSMAVTAEFTGDPPDAAVLAGTAVPVGAPASLPTAGFPGVQRVSLPPVVLGFQGLSLVLATRAVFSTEPTAAVYALPAHTSGVGQYTAAAAMLSPLFQEWLGTKPAASLELIDLPVADAAPSQDGDALLLSLAGDEPAALAASLSAPLAHAWFHSPRAWLSEGVPGLMQVLWTERTAGRDKALEQLGSERDALALAEPATPGTDGGQPLTEAEDAVFYRAKATSVLWMLRSIVGDAALEAALRAYDPAQDTTPGYFESLIEHAVAAQAVPSGIAPSTAGAPEGGEAVGDHSGAAELDPRDLHWFFENWVNKDPGLPDLAITNVFSSRTGAGDQWLVSVNVSNTGYAEAEVPIVVHSATTSVTVQVRVPARGTLSRRILLLGEPTEVDLNDGSVPEIEANAHRRTIQ